MSKQASERGKLSVPAVTETTEELLDLNLIGDDSKNWSETKESDQETPIVKRYLTTQKPPAPYDVTTELAINKANLSIHAPKEKAMRQWHSSEEIAIYMENMGVSFGLSPSQIFLAVVLLFNKGAANKGTPSTMSVEVFGREISKNDMLYHYKRTFGTTYIRRLAESMSPEIGTFSQIHKIPGDLARRINVRLLQEGEPTLTVTEAAWASSFHQGNDNLSNISDRMAQMLAQDYSERFSPKPKS